MLCNASTAPLVLASLCLILFSPWNEARAWQDKRELDALRVYTDPGELPRLKVKGDGKTVELPLTHTHVRATITGTVAEVEVTQTYQNPYANPIEAVYVFPLPENSAVFAMRMQIGERVIEAEVQKREEARRTYEQAKQGGHTAALLEQERPNIFTQSVANIEPGTDIDVVVRYLQTLTYDAGEYEFVFPMVVGPRFMPGAPLAGPQQGRGGKQDTTDVPDASRISPPVLGEGYRSGHDISLELTADAGLPISAFDVPTHDVEAVADDGELTLRLRATDSIPNRDFVLHYRVEGDKPQAAVLTHADENSGYFTLVVQPPKLDLDKLVGKRELVFVVDVSGSMSGVPLAMCQDAMEQAIGQLRPVDTFNVITFAGSTGKAFLAPRPANDANIKQALDFVRGMIAGGGTYMMDGIAAALSSEVEAGRNRYVFFMTDGYVGNEAQILDATSKYVAALAQKGQKAKVFGFGVGSSTNRYLLDGLGKAGSGLTVYASTREDPTLAVNAFYRLIDHPVIEDVTLDAGALDLLDMYPARLPDLFASRPLIVHGRYGKAGAGTIVLRGKANGRRIEVPLSVTFPERESANGAVETLWARAKIESLSRDLWAGDARQAIEAITKVGLEHHLVTAYTSLVAVDRSKKVDGKLETIVQPVETPEGVDADMAGATRLSRMYASSGAVAPAGQGSLLGGGGAGKGYGIGGGGASGRGAGYGGNVGLGARRKEERYAEGAPIAAPEAAAASEGQHLEQAFRIRAKDAARDEAKGALRITGAIDRDAVVRIVSQKRAELLALIGAKAGKLTLRWFIAADGRVLQVKVVSSTFNDAALERRIVEKVKQWRFPAPAGGGTVEVTYPLAFEAK